MQSHNYIILRKKTKSPKAEWKAKFPWKVRTCKMTTCKEYMTPYGTKCGAKFLSRRRHPSGAIWHSSGTLVALVWHPMWNLNGTLKEPSGTSVTPPQWHRCGTNMVPRGPNRGHIFAKGGSIYIKSTPEWSALQHNSRLSSFSLEHNIIYLFNDVQ